MSQPLHFRPRPLAGQDFRAFSPDGLRSLVRQTLQAGMHGLCFSPYLEGQGPGTVLGEAQIRERLKLVQPHTRWVRSFSCTDGNELIPAVAHELGLKTLVGVWLGTDLEKNEQELAAGLTVARAGHADLLAIGNEVLLREDLSEAQLIDYLARAKAAVGPGVKVGYVDAYYLFEEHPAVAEACDVLLTNCYPFWEGCERDYALLYMKDMYRRAQRAARGKPVIISETGWPDTGTAFWGAQPSWENAAKYFLDTQKWAQEEDVEIFWFSSFDETWKTGAEGDVGAFWGLWDQHGRSKFT